MTSSTVYPSAGHRYDYRPSWRAILLCALFFSGAAAGLFAAAANPKPHLLIDLSLSSQQAAVILRVLGSLSIGFVLLAGLAAFVRLKLRQHITLGDTGITLPRSRWSSQEIFVPFSRIVSASTTRVGRERFLKIDYGDGKFVLNGSMLPQREDFDEIRETVARKIES